MTRRIAVVFVCLAAWGLPAYGVFIDFETLPGGDVIIPEVALGNQFASLGVTFSAEEDGVAVSPTIQSPDVFFGVPAFSGTNYANNQIVGFGPSDLDNRADVFTMTFASPVTNVSFYADPNGSSDPVFNVYDASGALLETITVDNPDWILVTLSSTNISRIEGIQPSDTWNFSVDDLSFDVVPEPSTLAIAGLGLLSLGMFRRRKNG